MVPITVSEYRFTGFLPLSAACAAGAPTAPASATPAPVTADFSRNFLRFKAIS
ncbi:hypothetical protein TUSST3_51170 [Streptomyces sp. TUS-ST3]|nr:hypothetical protein TUSST3_51170 [Streptomyces sp. TUS-ST3]